jgi:divalent metal cation (Fe/Co/Zn/Cd) transporter
MDNVIPFSTSEPLAISLFSLPWLAAAAVFAIGIAWRDCVLIACATLIAFHAFHVHMDSRAPWQGWRAAVRCWLMGAGGMVAGLALCAMVAAAWLDWWQPDNNHEVQTLLVLAAATAACWVSRLAGPSIGLRLLADVLMPLAVVTAVVARANGLQAAPCVFAALTGAGVAWAGWRLNRELASELLAADSR